MTSKIEYEKAGLRLSQILEDQDLPVEVFARRLNVSKTMVNNYRRGQDRPSLATFNEMVRELRLSPEITVALLSEWGYDALARILPRSYTDDTSFQMPRLTDQRATLAHPYQQRTQVERALVKHLNQMRAGESVVLHGLPGVGKTTLADILARDGKVSRLFPGGVLFAEVGPGAEPVTAVLQRWLSLTGQPVDKNWADACLHQKLKAVLDDRRTLVWLDDSTQMQDGAAYQIFDGRICYLLTSRQHGVAYETTPFAASLRLEPLTPTQSRTLLKALVAHLPKPPQGALSQVVDVCQGIPRALELATKAIARWGWQGFLARIHNPQTRLAALALPRVSHLDHSILLTVDACYQDLPTQGRRCLQRLYAVIAPGGTDPQQLSLGDISKVWGHNTVVAQTWLELLVNASFLRQTADGAYTLQPFVADYLAALDDPDLGAEILAAQREFLAYHQRTVPPSHEALLHLKMRPNVTEQVEDWRVQFARLRVSAHLAARDGYATLLPHHFDTVEYLAQYYPVTGERYARHAVAQTAVGSQLEQAVTAQLHGWSLRAAGQAAASRTALRTAVTGYANLNDVHGQLACRFALRETLTRADRGLLRRFTQQGTFDLNDANLLLCIAADDEAMAGELRALAETIYAHEAVPPEPRFVDRLLRQAADVFTLDDESRYLHWVRAIENAPYCHHRAWARIQHAYSDNVGAKWPGARAVVLAVGAAPPFRDALVDGKAQEYAPARLAYLLLHLYKRALSSPGALLESLRRREQATSSEELPISLAHALVFDTAPLSSAADAQRAEQLVNLCPAQDVLDSNTYGQNFGADSLKLDYLRERLHVDFRRDCQKAIVYTSYHDTLDFLVEGLKPVHLGRQVIAVSGELSWARQRQQLARFAQAETGVLIVADSLPPEVSLPAAECEVIHNDVPWSRRRFAQRLERLAGQSAAYRRHEVVVLARTWEPFIANWVARCDLDDTMDPLRYFSFEGAARYLDEIGAA